VNKESSITKNETSGGDPIATAKPSLALRLMLDEKRRQIENRKSLDALNRAHSIDNANKEAFFRLYDKKSNGADGASSSSKKGNVVFC